PDLDPHLEVLDGAVLDLAAHLGDLEPVHVAQRLGGALDAVPDGLVDPVRGRSDDLGDSVGAIRHGAKDATRGRCPAPTYDREVRSRKKEADQDVVRITGAPVNLSQDVSDRQRRYLLSMAIRTGCFVAAVVCYTHGLHLLAWLLITASLFLPFVAVVIA